MALDIRVRQDIPNDVLAIVLHAKRPDGGHLGIKCLFVRQASRIARHSREFRAQLISLVPAGAPLLRRFDFAAFSVFRPVNIPEISRNPGLHADISYFSSSKNVIETLIVLTNGLYFYN